MIRIFGVHGASRVLRGNTLWIKTGCSLSEQAPSGPAGFDPATLSPCEALIARAGRPKKNKPEYKKKIRLEKKPRALEYREGGASITDIALYLGKARSTVQDWIKHSK